MERKISVFIGIALFSVLLIQCAGCESKESVVSSPAASATEIISAAPVVSGPVATVTHEAVSTPEISDIPAETALVSSIPAGDWEIQIERIAVSSTFLNKDMNVNVYLPPGYDISFSYPVLYFFHGYGGNEDDWEKNMALVDTASELFLSGQIEPYIIVTPDIENSYGVNTPQCSASAAANLDSGNYESYIIEELIPYIDANYSTITGREGRYIGGLSMGGFVALHLCFAHTELFSKAGGHSPALWIYSSDPNENGAVVKWLYPVPEMREERDPLLQAQKADLSGISIWLDCGAKDSYCFYEGAEKLYDILVSRGVKAEYHAFSGGHNTKYWSAHLKEYLIFYGS